MLAYVSVLCMTTKIFQYFRDRLKVRAFFQVNKRAIFTCNSERIRILLLKYITRFERICQINIDQALRMKYKGC